MNLKTSAVLLLLIKRENQFFNSLTERPTYEGVHSGQISFRVVSLKLPTKLSQIQLTRMQRRNWGEKIILKLLGA